MTHTAPRKRFSEQEDTTLKRLVRIYGSNDWNRIAQQMPGRNARQCRHRYTNYLNESYRPSPWSEAEDSIIISMYQELGPKWVLIAKSLYGRTGNDVKNRWHKHILKANPSISQSWKGGKIKSGPQKNVNPSNIFQVNDPKTISFQQCNELQLSDENPNLTTHEQDFGNGKDCQPKDLEIEHITNLESLLNFPKKDSKNDQNSHNFQFERNLNTQPNNQIPCFFQSTGNNNIFEKRIDRQKAHNCINSGNEADHFDSIGIGKNISNIIHFDNLKSNDTIQDKTKKNIYFEPLEFNVSSAMPSTVYFTPHITSPFLQFVLN